jgi:carbon monoxide dehydrogenase subunit G
MRIEGTYTLPATIDRVFAALLDPSLLQRIIPGCERLVQLGPAAQGGVTFEARVQSPHGPAAVTLKTTAIRRPDHLQVEIWGRAPDAPVAGQISVDLVEQGTHTVGAYVFTLATPATNAASQEVIAAVIVDLCERLGNLLYAQRMEKEALIEPGRAPAQGEASPALRPLPTRYQTPRGQIVALTSRQPRDALTGGIARQWAQRALWMGTGVLLGIAVISIGIGVARWLDGHED